MSRNALWIIPAVVALMFAAGNVSAGNIDIVNPGFDNVPILNGDIYSDISSGANWAEIPGWEILGVRGGGIHMYTGLMRVSHYFPLVGASATDQAAYTDGGTFRQILSTDLAANTEYTLSVMVGLADSADRWYDNRLELYAGGELLLSVPMVRPAAGYFTLSTLTYTTGADVADGQALEIRLVGDGWGSAQGRVAFDDVSLTAVAIPEPATMCLLALGGLAVIRRRR
ncbi:MAG: PEP-CTERM sorting domain-containing protein [Phycisphaerae bacterium]|nr:PEP-CTERM sorting domain-containing protein [Phycisphaerae bacterium]